ncbi:MAG: F0F1 ATP synthase subunit alpha, partial [Candidatus Onthovivens sp.]
LTTDLFNAGQRPAIDTGLSVSRVGSAAQFKVMKKVSSSIKMELANYHELKSFAQFGSDIDESTRKIINHGRILEEVLKQEQYAPYSVDREVIEIFAAKYGYLDALKDVDVKSFLNDLYSYISKFNKNIINEINKTHILSDELEAEMKKVIESYIEEKKVLN